ncbi:hypothetical protein AMECASPLE_011066 [Ameca splendens]|uniref:Uncharacterized protein n=1 Tax=Ameca splendens TaxID=208324 RepID=A0ABV0YNH1_9TELE
MEGPTLTPHPSFPFSCFHTLDYDMIVRFSPQLPDEDTNNIDPIRMRLCVSRRINTGITNTNSAAHT